MGENARESRPNGSAMQVEVTAVRSNRSLGIGSVVLGCVSFVLSLIPLVGLLGTPLALVGLVLGLVALIVASRRGGAGVGFAIAGLATNGMALAVALGFAYLISAGISGASKSLSSAGGSTTGTSGEGLSYFTHNMLVYEVSAASERDPTRGRVAHVRFTLRNNGSRTVRSVRPIVFFLDEDNKPIREEMAIPRVTGIFDPWILERELKPGYIQEFETIAPGCPTEWKEGNVSVTLGILTFVDDPATPTRD